MLLPINHNYKKICDILSFSKIKTQDIQEFFLFFFVAMKKQTHSSACAMAHTVQLLTGMICTVLVPVMLVLTSG